MSQQCSKPVGKGVLNFLCDLDQGHDGPCASRDNPPSMRARQRWQEGEGARRTLSELQGPAQTSAERYTEGATAPPDSGDTQFRDTVETRPGAVPESEISHPVCPACRDGRHDWCSGLKRNDEYPEAERVACPCYARSVEQHESGPWDSLKEPTKQRAGDQRLPEVNDRPSVQRALIADIEKRAKVGVERYGTELQPMNGRNTVLDAFEEALDLTTYLRSLLFERDELAEKSHRAVRVLGTLRDGEQVTKTDVEEAYESVKELMAWLTA